MNRILAICVVALLALLAASPRANAQPCPVPPGSPFGDVDSFDFFCSDVLWVRNASVTLGCGNGDNFCVGRNVSRVQMALFMRRLAEALEPDVLVSESDTTGLSGDLDAGGVPMCSNLAVSVDVNDGIPHYIHAFGVVSMRTTALADVQVRVTRSLNDGAYVPVNAVAPAITVQPSEWGHVAVVAPVGNRLDRGNFARYRIEASRASGGPATTGELAHLRCQLKLISTTSGTL